MASLSTDEIEVLCHNLVYQVAYAYYDSPYILILKLLINVGVCPELKAAEMLGINPADLRRYCGVLQSHRLIKRYSNKERVNPDDRAFFRRGGGPMPADGQPRLKEVAYWYIDYREFANVTKYKLAMIHKGIEEATKHQIGQRGYRCPLCGKTFDALQVPNLMDPATGLLYCDQCGTAVDEHDPNENGPNTHGGDEKLTRFNNETQPIRDALKAIEGITVPSVNIIAWIAQNVKQAPLPGQAAAEEENKKKYQVVIGDEGDERERIEKARLAEAQRTQNALPVWHTHSTVTGSATSLGIDASGQTPSNVADKQKEIQDKATDHQRGLADYYANLVEDEDEDEEDQSVALNKVDMPVKVEQVDTPSGGGMVIDGGDEDDGDMEETETPAAAPETNQVMVMVAGKPKPFDEVTTEDEAYLMTPEEREAYEEIMMAM